MLTLERQKTWEELNNLLEEPLDFESLQAYSNMRTGSIFPQYRAVVMAYRNDIREKYLEQQKLKPVPKKVRSAKPRKGTPEYEEYLEYLSCC